MMSDARDNEREPTMKPAAVIRFAVLTLLVLAAAVVQALLASG